MARSAGTTVENSFVNGLVTEATGMNFPENAVTESDNCVFDKTGKVERRLGIDLEQNYANNILGRSGSITTFKWSAVSQIGTVDFIVVQSGYYIHFYDASSTPLSAGLKSFKISLADYVSSPSYTTKIPEKEVSMASGNGYLFVAHKYCNPFYVSYNSDTDTIEVNAIEIKIRDFEGIEDGLLVDERPSTLSLEHEYNLHNQGWYGAIDCFSGGVQNAIKHWDDNKSDFPSNADIWFTYKDTDEKFNYRKINDFQLPNTPASKGHFIVDAFNIVRQIDYTGIAKPTGSLTTTDVTVVETQSTNGIRPSTVAFYAGRVWWSGVDHSTTSSNVYYSRIIEKKADFGACYQDNDPTSESFSDLLPSDGGVINIPEISNVIFLKPFKDYLMVFAENGVWIISGSDLTAFKADEYTVSKASEIGALSSSSFVSTESVPFWWNESGIYTVEGGSTGGPLFNVGSITRDRIQKFYDEIPPQSKFFAKGVYNFIEKKITWIYRSSNPSTFVENYDYDKSIVLDLNTGSFSPHTFDNTIGRIHSVISIKGNTNKLTLEDVTTLDGTIITTVALEDIQSQDIETIYLSSSEKYLVSPIPSNTIGSNPEIPIGNSMNYTWGSLYNNSFVDWFSVNDAGVPFKSYFYSGYKIRGEGMRDFQSNYIVMVSESNPNSSFLVSGRWDYSNDSRSLRNTTSQQGYVHKDYTDYCIRKLKIRGTGKVLQYKVESRPSAPFYIVGWSTFDSVNSST